MIRWDEPRFGEQRRPGSRKPALRVIVRGMNLGMTEMIFLVLLGLLLFGPKKLPEIGRQLGKVLNEFKRASHEFQSQLNDAVRKLEVEEAESTFTGAPEGTAARDGCPRLEPNSGEHTGETPGQDGEMPSAQDSGPEKQAAERHNG